MTRRRKKRITRKKERWLGKNAFSIAMMKIMQQEWKYYQRQECMMPKLINREFKP